MRTVLCFTFDILLFGHVLGVDIFFCCLNMVDVNVIIVTSHVCREAGLFSFLHILKMNGYNVLTQLHINLGELEDLSQHTSKPWF